jgi:hypothetical protein
VGRPTRRSRDLSTSHKKRLLSKTRRLRIRDNRDVLQLIKHHSFCVGPWNSGQPHSGVRVRSSLTMSGSRSGFQMTWRFHVKAAPGESY